jgi:hypothetical protein
MLSTIPIDLSERNKVNRDNINHHFTVSLADIKGEKTKSLVASLFRR